MKYIHRSIENELRRAKGGFPALMVTGPRRSGKTTLLRKLFPKAAYYLLEDLDIISRVRNDPRSFIDELKPPAILDEIQNAPELFNYLRTIIDRNPRRYGQWLFTGSQESSLMRGVSESMAGRIALFQLLPLSMEESKNVSIHKGGFPEVLARPRLSDIWFRSYIQTYLERDVLAVSSIRDLATFRRFLALVASRSGQILNKTALAAPMGVSVPTITEWLNIMELTGQIILIPPFYENFGKRIIKSSKIYFVDSGLLCHLLRIPEPTALEHSPFFGSIFEGFVASEIIKWQINRGKSKDLYYFRDQQGLEVDFILPTANAGLLVMEAKATRTIYHDTGMALDKIFKNTSRYSISKYIIHLPIKTSPSIHTVRPGTRAIPINALKTIL